MNLLSTRRDVEPGGGGYVRRGLKLQLCRELIRQFGADDKRRRRRGKRTRLLAAVLVIAWGVGPLPAPAAQTLVAVASNFAEAVKQLQITFEQESGHQIAVTSGSTGKLYAQIQQGAPFDIFLAADQRRPELLEKEGHAVHGSRFTYAAGRLALWSPDPRGVSAGGVRTLRTGTFRRIAIANPDLAPYGAAARETLASLELLAALSDRIVLGENIGQAHALVATGNAEIGFVALSYVLSPRNPTEGSRWEVPPELHKPIRQDAVLLTHGADNPVARAFLAYLRGEKARDRIRAFGYTVD